MVQLNELGKATLQSYFRKSSNDVKKRTTPVDAAYMTPRMATKNKTKINNRWTGMDRAITKLTKMKESYMNESVAAIVKAAIAGNPLDVKTTVETAIGEKVAASLEQRKIVIAKNIVAVDEGFKPHKKGKEKNKDEPAIVKKAPWNEGLDTKQFIAFVNEEFEVDVQDEDELELILEDLSDEEKTLLVEHFQEQLNEATGKAKNQLNRSMAGFKKIAKDTNTSSSTKNLMLKMKTNPGKSGLTVNKH